MLFRVLLNCRKCEVLVPGIFMTSLFGKRFVGARGETPRNENI